MSEYTYGGPERRKFPRIPFWYIVRYKVCSIPKGNVHSKKELLKSRSKDISLGGILLETKRCYTASTILEIEIDVPLNSEQHVYAKIKGAVVRSALIGDKLFDTAVEFISVPKEYQENIKQLINAFANT